MSMICSWKALKWLELVLLEEDILCPFLGVTIVEVLSGC